jgi:hypothetical protein
MVDELQPAARTIEPLRERTGTVNRANANREALFHHILQHRVKIARAKIDARAVSVGSEFCELVRFLA